MSHALRTGPSVRYPRVMNCDVCGKAHVTHGLTFTDGPYRPLCEQHYVDMIDYMAQLTIKSATQSGTTRELWG